MRPLKVIGPLKLIGIAAVLALAVVVLYLFHKTSRLEQELERAKPHFERIAVVR
jgi:hypothetical protein